MLATDGAGTAAGANRPYRMEWPLSSAATNPTQVVQDARIQVDAHEYEVVIKRLDPLAQACPTFSAEAQYLLAYSLHATNQGLDEALERYTIALKLGFEPFWVYYNRGALYNTLAQPELACADLKKAHGREDSHG